MDGSRVIGVDNAQAVNWKFNTKNEFQARGHIEGVVTRVFKNKGEHNHFEIKIGEGAKDTIEVVYNNIFGALPKMDKGMHVEACGDYITSYAKSSKGYDASPSGAIIHWVHQNVRRGDPHEHGFLVIESVLYGFQHDGAADPRGPADNDEGRDVPPPSEQPGNGANNPENPMPPIPPVRERVDCRKPRNRNLPECRRTNHAPEFESLAQEG